MAPQTTERYKFHVIVLYIFVTINIISIAVERSLMYNKMICHGFHVHKTAGEHLKNM